MPTGVYDEEKTDGGTNEHVLSRPTNSRELGKASPEQLRSFEGARNPNGTSNMAEQSEQARLAKLPSFASQVKGGDGSSLEGAAKGLTTAERAAGDTAGDDGQAGTPGKGLFQAGVLNPGNKLKALMGRNKKRAGILGGVTALLASLGATYFMTLLPNGLNSFVSKTENRFFASAKHTTDQQSEAFFNDYLRHHVLNGFKEGCNTKLIEPRCVSNIEGEDPVTKLYKTWRNNKVEEKLAKLGIEFGKTQGRLYMKAPGLTPDGIDIKDFQEGKVASIFDYPEVKDSQVRAVFHDAMEAETAAKRVMLLILMRQVAKKYDFVRCHIACNEQDRLKSLKTSAQDKVRSGKAFFIRRVLQPAGVRIQLTANCVIAGAEACLQLSPDGGNREPTTELEKTIRSQMDTVLGEWKSEGLAKILKDVDVINSKGGWLTYISEKIAGGAAAGAGADAAGQAVAGEAVSKTVVSGVSGFGWATLASKFIEGLKNLPTLFSQARSKNTNAAYADTYATARTIVSEQQAHKTSSSFWTSFYNMLKPGQKKDGSGAAAWSTPWYKSLFGTDKQNVHGHVTVPNGQKDIYNYTCDDGKPVPNNKLVCDEENAAGGSPAALKAISDAIPQPVADLAGAVTKVGDVGGWLLQPLSSILGHIEPFKSLETWLGSIVSEFMQWIVEKSIPMPLSDNMSGGRLGDGIIGGADVTGNDLEHHVYGGHLVKPARITALVDEQNRQAYAAFARKSVFARIFDKTSQYSLVSRLADVLPHGFADWQTRFAQMVANPISSFLGSFSSVFSSNHVLADTVPTDDPIGVDQYATDDNSPAFTSPDIAAYWKQNCQDGQMTQRWINDAAQHVNSVTGEAANYTDNPCMTINAGLTASGAYMGYDPQL